MMKMTMEIDEDGGWRCKLTTTRSWRRGRKVAGGLAGEEVTSEEES